MNSIFIIKEVINLTHTEKFATNEFEYGHEDEFKTCVCFGHQFNLQDEVHVINDKSPVDESTREMLISLKTMTFYDCYLACRANDIKSFKGLKNYFYQIFIVSRFPFT